MTAWFNTIPASVAFAALAFATSAAATEDDEFSAIDTDASGGLSLEEIQTTRPDVSAADFLAQDVDGSGELSSEEFSAWASADAENYDSGNYDKDGMND